MAGPIGPRGFNGTQGQRGYPGPIGYNGSRGDPGSQGKQGPPGAGNLTLCEYKSKMTKSSPGGLAYNSVAILEAAVSYIIFSDNYRPREQPQTE